MQPLKTAVRSAPLDTTKTKTGKEQKVSSTYTSLSQSNKDAIRPMLRETTPGASPSFEIISLLRKCDEAFNDSVAAVGHRGMPANRIACISHMLCDEEGLGLTAGCGTMGGVAAATTYKKELFLMHLSRRLIFLRSVSVKTRIGLLLKRKRQW